MKNKKRVILINGDTNKSYDQAIFIMKSKKQEKAVPVNFVAEAEKIINNYMLEGGINLEPKITSIDAEAEYEVVSKTSKKNHDFETTLNAIMLMCCIILLCGLMISIR